MNERYSCSLNANDYEHFSFNHLGFHAKSLKSNYKQYIFVCNKYLDLLKLPEQPGLVSGSHAHFAKSTEHCEFQRTCYTFIGEVQDLFLILGSSVLKSAPEGQSAPRVYTRAVKTIPPFPATYISPVSSPQGFIKYSHFPLMLVGKQICATDHGNYAISHLSAWSFLRIYELRTDL